MGEIPVEILVGFDRNQEEMLQKYVKDGIVDYDKMVEERGILINLINTLITNVMSRKQEFAMLQSIGMSNRQLVI